MLLSISAPGVAQEEYCCLRTHMFPSFPMPQGQEYDLSRGISFIWISMINKTGAHELGECPLPIENRTWEGSREVDNLTENMLSATLKIQPNYLSDEEARKGADYIWKGKLELLSINKIIPGEWEDAYIDEHTKPGTKHYEPGYAIGKWRFTIQLYNPFWDEVVKEATTSVWEGTGDLDEPYANLYSQNFSNLKEIILEYEKTPKKAEFESEVIKVDPEKTKRITFKVTDEKGEKPKKWQRLAVKVDFGSLTNGTPCCDTGEDAKFYSFMCEEGEVTIEYKAPDPDRTTLDNITVYNGCIITSPDIIDMSMIDIQDEIGVVKIALVSEGYSGTITITQSWDYADDYGNTFIGSKTVTCKGTYKPIEELRGMERQPLHWFGPSKVVATWEIKEDMYCAGDDCPGHCKQEFGQGTLAPDMWQELTIMTWVFPLEIKEVADQLGEIGMENYYVISVTPGLTDVITETREKGGDPCVWNVKQSEEDIPGAIIQYKLVDVDKLQGHRTWKSKHGETSYNIEITDMPDFQGEHVEPVKPVPDGTDYTYTVTWNLISL